MPSTVIEYISYDAATQVLKVHFLSGAVYAYNDVPENIYEAFKKYKSKGTFLNKYIKDKYDFERIN
ncbi:KTSC domain-containing protein [Taibaiella lutea]|uniref:KTSC domain-containing protein n=1 Tax=Taibaiella lutea TaxID=2608001 RepID=A0A5M6CAD9_9BACT|nr:KTSC domain-containing protein [Taibaiella lutea]KAA5532136.1 KTSC domain-containing protein [Taibaiella lutea]